MPLRPFEEVRALIHQNKLEEAFTKLFSMKPGKSIRTEIDLLFNRYNRLERQSRLDNEEQRNWNKFIYDMLRVVEIFEQDKKNNTGLTSNHGGIYFYVLGFLLIAAVGICWWFFFNDAISRHENPETFPSETLIFDSIVFKKKNETMSGNQDIKPAKLLLMDTNIANRTDTAREELFMVYPLIIRYNRFWKYKVFINKEPVSTRDTLFPNKTHGKIVNFRQIIGLQPNRIKILDQYGRIACQDSFPEIFSPYQEISPCF